MSDMVRQCGARDTTIPLTTAGAIIHIRCIGRRPITPTAPAPGTIRPPAGTVVVAPSMDRMAGTGAQPPTIRQPAGMLGARLLGHPTEPPLPEASITRTRAAGLEVTGPGTGTRVGGRA